MNTAYYVILAVVGAAFVAGIIWGVKTALWNRRLSHFKVSIGGAPIAITKSIAPQLTLVSSLAVTLVGAAVILPSLEQPIDTTGLIRQGSAMRVGTASKLASLMESTYLRNWGDFATVGSPEAMEDGAMSSSAASSVVGTNEQVEGVAEADVIKTDGSAVYYAPRYSNTVNVFDIGDEGGITLEHMIDLGNVYTDSLFITDEYLVVIGYSYDTLADSCETDDAGAETYCMARLWYAPSGTALVIDRSTLEIEYSLRTDGYFMEYRLIDDSLFLVGYNYLYNRVDLRPTLDVMDASGDDVREEEVIIDYNDIYYFDDVPNYSMTVLTGLKLGSFELSTEAYLGYVNTVYVSPNALYTSETVYNYDTITQTSEYYVHVVKFDINVDEAKLQYRASSSVRGQPLNQFSLDEFDGNLRLATTESTWSVVEVPVVDNSSSDVSGDSVVRTVTQWQRVVKNYLYVLSPSVNDTFEITGLLSEGLGKEGESIRSVRFDGETAYVVTFLQTDPLYIIDLSDESSPSIVGTQYENGFNTYLHPWGEDHLLGIGYDATSSGQITGMKMSVYSTDTSAEEALETVTFSSISTSVGANWTYSYSEALWNHKALLISDDVGIVAFAVQAYEYGYEEVDNKAEYYWENHSYYYIFKIDVSADQMIADPIIIEHDTSEEYYLGVDRGVYINGYVYTFSPTQVVVVNFSTGQQLPALNLE